MESKGIVNVPQGYFRDSVGVILMFNSHDTIGPLQQWIKQMDFPYVLSLWMNISDGRVSTNESEMEDFSKTYKIEDDMRFIFSFDDKHKIQWCFRQLVYKIHSRRLLQQERAQSLLRLAPQEQNKKYCPSCSL